MAIGSSAEGRGKRRAFDKPEEVVADIQRGPDIAGPSSLAAKKVKRAETRQCPICSEHIPVRLLEAHCDLETQRTEEIIRSVGSSEVYGDSVDGIQFSRARRSAARAKKAFSQSGSGPDSTSQDTTARTEKMIKTVKRRRKQRFRRLREMIQSSNDDSQNLNGREGGFVCPVCLERLFGDPDVTEAHVDACLVHAMPSAYEETEIDIGGPTRTRVTDGANLTALGFHVRDANHEDVEEEIDVYGDDDEVFGQAQFTEVDILSASRSMSTNRESETSVEVGEVSGLSMPPSRHPPSDSHPEPSNLVPTCRICLDPYTEPTVSTQCWHTCCRECWLRCLESRLCPICKRITTASDLRRIYI